jgi:hypothetical protein
MKACARRAGCSNGIDPRAAGLTRNRSLPVVARAPREWAEHLKALSK